MSIRNSLILAQLLSFSVIVTAADGGSEWKKFKENHDVYILVKNNHKNEELWAKFSLRNLPDDPHQVTWIEREDFLPKDDKRKVEDIKKASVIQCNYYESKVGGADEKVTMLTLGFVQSEAKNYLFVMESYYSCITAFIVPQDSMKSQAQEKAAQFFGKVKELATQAWSSITGRNA